MDLTYYLLKRFLLFSVCCCMKAVAFAQSYHFKTDQMWNANQRFPGKALTIRVSPEGHKAKPERLEIILADEEDEAKVVAAI